MRHQMTLAMWMFAVLLTSTTTAKAATILPDSCGSDKIDFDIQKHKGGAPLAPPAEGKAQIVLMESVTGKPSAWTGTIVSSKTTRFGMDGTWLGAAKDNTYFAMDIAPGEHHLCSSIRGSKDTIAMKTFTAEAGKVYYFEFKIDYTVVRSGNGAGKPQSSSVSQVYDLTPLDEEHGKFRIKAFEVAISKPN